MENAKVNIWENPLLTGGNKLPPHADRNYPHKLDLCGEWEFGYFTGTEKFENCFDLPLNKTFQIPGHPELAGFGQPHYTNFQYPFPPMPPQVPHENNYFFVFRRSFTIPEAWQGKRVIISFQGADSFLKFTVNGREAGFSKGSRNPAEFDITPFLVPGENTISAATLRWSDATYLEDQDMWYLSGIFREVFLYAKGECFIEDFEVKTTLDEFSLSLKTSSHCEVKVKLDGVLEYSGSSDVPLKQKVEVTPWSAENPRLYDLEITTPDDCIRTRVGFRTVAIRNGELLINGKSVKLFGVNHHIFNCKSGRTVSEEDLRWDAMTLKAHNFNAVRNSHYPADSVWYDLCDEYGLYVIDEADLETHGLKDVLSDDPLWEKAYLDREERMLERNKNHPSIIIWSIGNESYYGCNIQACADYLHARDTSRPVNYYHAGIRDCVDIVGMHYPSLEKVEEALREEKSNRPILLEEFAHSMGNGTGNMAEYVALWESEPRLIGGFIWDWIDQGLLTKTPQGVPYFAYGGDFGDTPNDFQFCHNGIVTPDRKVKAALADLKHVFRPFVFTVENGRLFVRNRTAFTELASCKVLFNGAEELLCCSPGETRCVKEAIPPYLEIAVYGPQGNLLEEEQFGLPPQPEYPACGEPAFCDGNTIGSTVLNGDFLPEKLGGTEIFSFDADIFRAPTNNDRPFLEMWRESRIAETYILPDGEPEWNGNTLRVKRKSPHFSAEFLFTFCQNGFKLAVDFIPGGNLPECLPKVGLTLKLPKNSDTLLFYGKGPQECYRDRSSGAKTACYRMTAEELYNLYLMPQENGNHCGVYASCVCDQNGCGIGCRSAVPFETALRRHDARTMDAALHEYDLPDSDFIYWHLDYLNAGVGNGSHGPGTLEKYRIVPAQYHWEWDFFVFDKAFSDLFHK